MDTWDALAGETRWVDYSAEQDGEDLVVYIHAFRRRRERFDSNNNVLFWKPATTGVARRYGAGEWAGGGSVPSGSGHRPRWSTSPARRVTHRLVGTADRPG